MICTASQLIGSLPVSTHLLSRSSSLVLKSFCLVELRRVEEFRLFLDVELDFSESSIHLLTATETSDTIAFTFPVAMALAKVKY